MRWLPIALLGFMLAEIAVFVWVGKLIGAFAVVLLVILSGICGAGLIRRQGFKTLQRLRGAMDGRPLEPPSGAPGIFPMLAGLLLLLPGFISDAVALLLLLPPVQRRLAAKLSGYFNVRTVYRTRPGTVIEAEAVDIGEPPERRLPDNDNSPWRR
jgi:UPF0716 protein FxsA